MNECKNTSQEYTVVLNDAELCVINLALLYIARDPELSTESRQFYEKLAEKFENEEFVVGRVELTEQERYCVENILGYLIKSSECRRLRKYRDSHAEVNIPESPKEQYLEKLRKIFENK